MNTRSMWIISKHDEANNKYDASSVAQKVQVAQSAFRDAASDVTRAKKAMLEVLGDGAAATVKRWLRAAADLGAGIVEELADVPWLSGGFVFPWGRGRQARRRGQ